MLALSVLNAANGQILNARFATGDVINWNFTGQINGVPIDLSGSEIKMTIGFPVPLLLTTGNGYISIVNAAYGQFSVNITSTETAAFAPGTYPYDLWIEPSSSPPVETQYITGYITVAASVTEVP